MTSAAKPRPLLRLNQRAALIPSAQYASWHEARIGDARSDRARPPDRERLREHHRRLHVQGYAGRLSIERWRSILTRCRAMSGLPSGV